jgi:hypothetical protein
MARVYQDKKERARLAEAGKNPDKAAWYVCIKRGRKSIARRIGKKKGAETVAAQWETEKRLRQAGVTADKSCCSLQAIRALFIPDSKSSTVLKAQITR